MPPDTAGPALPPVPAFRPYDAEPFRMAMGLVAIGAADWLEFADDHHAQMAERRRLIDRQPDAVLACLAEARPAAEELRDALAAHLCQHHAPWFSLEAGQLHNRLLGEATDPNAAADPLEWCGRTVQEDFCLMQPHADGHRLTGAVLCFPTRWSLAEKLGRPLAAVHDNVPFYADRLASPVERFFASLKVGRLAQRLNWSVIDDPALFQLTGKGRDGIDPDISADTALTRLYLRVERQTFRRLPRSGAVVFGIRVHVTRLDRVVESAGEAARLSAALGQLPPAMAHYKSTGRFSAALQAALSRV